MNNRVFGELSFSTGWKSRVKYSFFGKEQEITLKVRAYSEKDGITPAQEDAYRDYVKERESITKKVDKMLLDFAPEASNRFSPRTLLFNRDGSYALLCDDFEEPDEGIAVSIRPNAEIISQDDYL